MSVFAKKRSGWILIGATWLGAVALLATAALADDLSDIRKNRVWLVERADSGNILFRGNLPLSEGSTGEQNIHFEELINLLKSKYQKQVGGTAEFPDRFIFVDFSLINGDLAAELPDLYQEYRSFGGLAALDGNPPFLKPGDAYPSSGYFQINPMIKGQLVWEPIAGLSTRPKSNSTKQASQQIMDEQIPVYPSGQKARPLYAAVGHLSDVMAERADVPKIVYLHCMNGHDRTTEMAACYLLKTRPSLDLAGVMKRTIADVERLQDKDVKRSEDGVPYIQQLKPGLG